VNSTRAWLLASRPATLTAAISPVLVGSSLALPDETFRLDATVVALFSAVAIQVGVNFANDLFDARRGADTPDRIGPPRAVAVGLISEQRMAVGIWIAFGSAVLGGIYLTAIAGPIVIVIGVAAIVAALGYTGGPFPYGYRALGEVFVFVFFGPIATVGSRFVQDQTAPLDAWLMSVPVGLLITAILVVNNIRDIETDAAAGKRTLAVVLGRASTRWLLTGLLAGSAVWTVAAAASGGTPAWTLLGLAAFIGAPRLLRTVWIETAGPPLIEALSASARLQAYYAGLATLGIVLSAAN
jgi:1,4-dihydroxy-2-naphthoate octaprenyltransferase